MNKAKREVINVWPVSNRGVFKGFVKITFAESVAVFPMKLMEGNHGYFLGFPKVTQSDGTKRQAGRFLYQDANRMLTEDVLRSYIPGTPICREFQMKENLFLYYRVYPQPVRADCLVATASLEINHQIRIEGIRLFQLRDGVRMILYPEVTYKGKGEQVIRPVVEFRQDVQKQVFREFWRIYDAKK